MLFKIKHRHTDKVLYSAGGNSLAEVLTKAVREGADLWGANLVGANLEGANLTYANLTGAYLTYADLKGANLTGADLEGADLTGADLTGANLKGADLTGADLKGAKLYRANLTGANLKDAYLTGANLTGANLTGAYLDDANLTYANLKGADLSKADLDAIQVDYYDVLSRAPDEVPALLQSLRNGQIDGSTYTGECACLVGTIAKVRKVSYTDMKTLKPDSSRPAERWFLAIRKGDTPKTNPVAALVETWTEEWVRSNS